MTKHSTLTDPNDLHYAKLRTFIGNPLNVLPDFLDELIIASDTDKIYRSIGTTAGALVELSPQGNQGNQSGSLISTGLYLPSYQATSVGELYFEILRKRLWISVRANSLSGWVPVIRRFHIYEYLNIEVSLDEGGLEGYFELWANSNPSASDLDTNLGVIDAGHPENGADGLIAKYGSGTFAIRFVETQNPNSVGWQSRTTAGSLQELRQVQVNGVQISDYCLVIPRDYPELTPPYETLLFNCEVY
jgi:hypothetical protein